MSLINIKKLGKIKIPKNVIIILDKINKLIIIKGPFGVRYIKQKFIIIFIKNKKTIYVTEFPLVKKYKNPKKFLKENKTFCLEFKKKIIEVSIILIKKLKFIGLSYKFILIDKELNIFQLNLGYSHKIFFKPPKNITLNYVKNTTLYLKSFNYNLLSKVTARIRSYRQPEPYKGKGILYENEKIIRKKSKKL